MKPREPTDDQQIEDEEKGETTEATPAEESTETRQSRKREREVSLEPGTPQATTSDAESGPSEARERRKPAKKNRVSAQLDTTAELEEGGDSAPASTQSLSGSPPHESKMRQISQGVEDLTWQNMPKQSTPELDDQPQPEAEQDQDSSAVEGQHEPMDAENVSDNQQASDDGQQEAQGETVIPPSLRGENPPLIVDNDGADEHAGEADPAAAPPVAQPEEPSTPPPRSTSPMLTSPQRNAPSASASTSRRGSDSSMDQEKGLKRKLADRTTTEHQTLAENGITLATKRPRDDPDKDENPREPKRPTPPPDGSEANSKKTEASPPVQKPAPTTPQPGGGFMAYASVSSPFASVKGPSLFSSKPAPWAGIASASTTTPAKPASPSPVLGTPLFANSLAASTLASSPPKEQSLKRTGFEAFASSSSPFASAAKRPKSPPPMQASLFGHRSKSPARHHSPARVNAFSAYASSAHAFSGATHRRSGSGSPALSNAEPAGLALASENGNNNNESQDDSGSEKGVSFGDRLRASKDDGEDEDEIAEKKLNLTEQEVHTGEEDELTVYQVRGKLFTLSDQQQWKERGTGQLKLNVRRDDGGGARLLMRKEAVYTLLLNATLFKGMKCSLAQDPRYIRFSVLDGGVTTHYNIRVSNSKIAEELIEEINARIP